MVTKCAEWCNVERAETYLEVRSRGEFDAGSPRRTMCMFAEVFKLWQHLKFLGYDHTEHYSIVLQC